ncbi:arylamine N-acetyltransferase [Bacillus oleivorans]|uniref:Arylamine N-acetyltransferase n=1 Tax=Bacillus oleivorans TaxID=1448271 RepID=A0A285CUU4_9BACI|nr:arylamine N-acetyltransferase [Bacillus oleivorans]
MAEGGNSLRDYLKKLGIGTVKENSLEQIEELTRAHLHTFPFELISKYTLAGENIEKRIPTVAEFLERNTQLGWGGNCYVLNGRFIQLLDWLGYDVELVPVEKGHIAIWLSWKGEDYLVDAGYAGPFFEPIPIKTGNWVVETFYETSHFERSEDGGIVWTRVLDGGEPIVTKTLYLRKLTRAEFDFWLQRAYTDIPENRLFRKIEVTWYPNGERHQLMNTKYTVHKQNGEHFEKIFDNREEWIQLIEDKAGISRISTEKALRFLSERGVELF